MDCLQHKKPAAWDRKRMTSGSLLVGRPGYYRSLYAVSILLAWLLGVGK